jgi:hypothetical protein
MSIGSLTGVAGRPGTASNALVFDPHCKTCGLADQEKSKKEFKHRCRKAMHTEHMDVSARFTSDGPRV